MPAPAPVPPSHLDLLTALERQSGRDLLTNRRLSLVVVDPENTVDAIHP